ncbi:GNAT family N-acetyltransferase [Sporosarcina sp. USHLN248]|uniref:GNAT family N-acetyltransferase n=1 Tax=Sporosarcina sp. USHLN248 TaxID=3081300 RepID=UPI00301A79FF
MKRITLVPHQLNFAEGMSELSSSPLVKNALGLTDEQTTVEGTRGFIEFILEQEKQGNQYSRCILNEDNQLIGVITLKDIDPIKKTCHIGTWIGHPYWGQGYNQLAKAEILYIAFTKLGLNYVFAGAKIDNLRSQKAQEKLPYIKLFVENDFPEEHQKLESQVNSKCILNVVEKETFLSWYRENGVLLRSNSPKKEYPY